MENERRIPTERGDDGIARLDANTHHDAEQGVDAAVDGDVLDFHAMVRGNRGL
jgi:hypothetical protein